MICTNCDKELEMGMEQCPYCGCHFPLSAKKKREQERLERERKELERKARLAKMEEQKNDTEGQSLCPNCGKPLHEGALFCKWCGISLQQDDELETSVPPVSKRCPNCGKELKPEALFCNRCGQRIQ